MVSATNQLKLLANDGKRYLTDVLDYDGIVALGKEFPGKKPTDLSNGLHTAMKVWMEKAKQKRMLYSKALL